MRATFRPLTLAALLAAAPASASPPDGGPEPTKVDVVPRLGGECLCWTLGCPPDPSKPWCPPPKPSEQPPTNPDGAIACDGSPMHVVAGHKDQSKACIRKQLAAQPNISGRVEMHWVIKPSGGVTDVRCNHPEPKNAVMAACLKDAISTWKFDERLDGKPVPVDFPFKC